MSDAISFVAGLFCGLLSGLLPGLHSNTIISVLASLGMDEHALAVMIVSLYPAHLVTSFIPSIFFGIPESSTVVAVLPGQRMVLRGRGIVALKTVLLSCIIAAFFSVALFYLSLDIFPLAYGAIRAHMKYILLGISIVLLSRSRKPELALLIFLLSGMLGHYSLNSGMYDPFLPLFSGMFAMAAILNYKGSTIPEQEDDNIGFGFVKFTALGVFLGMLADMIPGVGSPSQVATFATIFLAMNTASYLATISSISVSQGIFSFSTAASIGKARVGATAWLSKFISIDENLFFLVSVFILSMAVAVFAIYAFRSRIGKLASLDFSRMNIILAAYLVAITFLLNGALGLAVLTVGSVLGWATIRIGVERINLMGAIIVPTLLLLFRIII